MAVIDSSLLLLKLCHQPNTRHSRCWQQRRYQGVSCPANCIPEPGVLWLPRFLEGLRPVEDSAVSRLARLPPRAPLHSLQRLDRLCLGLTILLDP